MKIKPFFLVFFAILLVSNASAFFTLSHEWWNLKGLETVDSTITRQCGDMVQIDLDGNTAMDVPVLHYYDDDVMSYIFTHVKNAYNSCLAQAGEDEEQQCFCHFGALHIVQDSFSHLQDGLTSKYIEKEYASNFFGHMVIEKSFENKHMALVENDPLYNDLLFYDSHALDSLFDETGGNSKFLRLLNTMTGLDASNDARIFRTGYQGEGFNDTVYKDKVSLPWWMTAIAIGIMIIGFSVAILFGFLGKTNWKWTLVGLYTIIGIIGTVILISFMQGSTWKLVTFATEVPAKVGYLRVSDGDVAYYDNVVQDATNTFLRTGKLYFEDASGLSYYDSEDNFIEGALIKAEKKFSMGLFPVLIGIFVILNIFLFYKSLKKPKK